MAGLSATMPSAHAGGAVAHGDLDGGGPGRGLPEIVFTPAHPAAREGGEVVFEVRELPDGTAVLPVYSSTSQLVAALGPAQPWAAFPLQIMRELMAAAGVGLVALDPEITPGSPRWRLEDLVVLEENIADQAGEGPC
jgi:hypothetical protein